ncbi:MAG TPA: glycosyltransferase family 39 protein [Candidatus Limnocylindrales bacterium]|nr:glycosyltransferase family 39 protein [Candidatus Limnocylindrales bacterium]
MRTPIALYGLALAVRAILIGLYPYPAYPDAYYYVDVARSLAEGRGLTVDFVWIFAEVGGRLPAEPTLPIPSNAHWMPLASLVQVPFLVAFGPTPVASALPFALIGATAAPLAWAIARDAGAPPIVQVGAGLLTAFPTLSLVFMAQPDNFSLYQPLVAGSLWLAARGLRGDRRAFVLAGLLAGLATLSRNDGVLVAATLGLVVVWDRLRAWRSADAERPRIPFAHAAGALGLFAATVAPWYARQLAVFGTLSPSQASGKVLFVRSIEEWNSISTPATLDWLLGQGLGPLLASRLLGLVAAAGIFAVLIGGVALVPFIVLGAWRRRRSADFGPFLTYAALLFGFSALVSAVHVPGGTFIHSAVALAPHGYVLALEGIAAAVGWVAARRRSWDRAVATRVFVAGGVAFGIATAVAYVPGIHEGWSAKRAARLAIAATLDRLDPEGDDRIMSIDAAGYRYYTGRGGVVLPNDPLPVIEQVARAYGIRWLVVEADDAVPAVAPIVLEDRRPAWVGPATLHGVRGEIVAGPIPPGVLADVALYPVCVVPGDERCASAGAAA